MSQPERDDWAAFLAAQVPSNRVAYGIFDEAFREALPGARVLDFGAGRCALAAIMAMHDARVLAVDISESTEAIAAHLAGELGLEDRLEGRSGDVRHLDLEAETFDFVIGGNVLHHLVQELEAEILELFARILKPTGRCRFVEPCENWALLDALKDRCFPEKEPHPERPNDTDHYRSVGERYFRSVSIEPYGSLERLARLVPGGPANGPLRARLLEAERVLPRAIHHRLAGSQRIEYRDPRRS